MPGDMSNSEHIFRPSSMKDGQSLREFQGGSNPYTEGQRSKDAEAVKQEIRDRVAAGERVGGGAPTGPSTRPSAEIFSDLGNPKKHHKEKQSVQLELQERANELVEYYKHANADLVGEVRRAVEKTLKERVFPGSYASFDTAIKIPFNPSLPIPVGSDARYGGVMQRLYEDELYVAMEKLSKAKAVAQADKDELNKQLKPERTKYKAHINVTITNPETFVADMPKTQPELDAVLAGMPPAERAKFEANVKSAWVNQAEKAKAEHRAAMLKVVQQKSTLLSSALKQTAVITLEDAYALITGNEKQASTLINKKLDTYLNGQVESEREFAKTALQVFTRFVGSGEADRLGKDYDKLAELAEDTTKIIGVRDAVRRFGSANDAKGRAEEIAVNEDVIQVLAGNEDGGEARQSRWFTDSMKFLENMDKKGLWPVYIAQSTTPAGMNPALAGAMEGLMVDPRDQVESAVKGTLFMAVLETYGVVAERASDDSNGKKAFGDNYFGNIEYPMNPSGYLKSKRGKDDGDIDDIHLPQLIGSYPSWLAREQNKVGPKTSELRVLDVTKIDLDSVKANPDSYRAWMIALSKATRGLLDVEGLINEPSSKMDAWLKMANGGLSHLFSYHKDEMDGADLEGRRNPPSPGFPDGGLRGYGNLRNAILIQVGEYAWKKDLEKAVKAWQAQRAEGKGDTLFRGDKIRDDMMRKVQDAMSMQSSGLQDSALLSNFIYNLQEKGLYGTEGRRLAVDAFNASAPVRVEVGKLLKQLFGGAFK